MTEYTSVPLHELLAGDQYWAVAGSVAAATGSLATAALRWAGEFAPGARRVMLGLHEITEPGTEGKPPHLRQLPLPAGDMLPVLSASDPGVLRVMTDSRRVITGKVGARKTHRLFRGIVSRETFDELAAEMEATPLPFIPAVSCAAETPDGDPAVVSREVRYVKGSAVPAAIRRHWPHVAVTAPEAGIMLDPAKPWHSTGKLIGPMLLGTTVIAEGRSSVTYSRTYATHLKGGTCPAPRRKIPKILGAFMPFPGLGNHAA